MLVFNVNTQVTKVYHFFFSLYISLKIHIFQRIVFKDVTPWSIFKRPRSKRITSIQNFFFFFGIICRHFSNLLFITIRRIFWLAFCKRYIVELFRYILVLYMYLKYQIYKSVVKNVLGTRYGYFTLYLFYKIYLSY